MRTMGFVLVLLGIVTIYLAVKGKVQDAFTALLTGQVPSNTNQAATTQPNTQDLIKKNSKLTPEQKKMYSDALNPFSPSHGGALGG